MAANPAGGRTIRPGSRMAAMADKLRCAGRRSRYGLRKQVVEPVFGEIKGARGFRQLSFRGFEKTAREWTFICAVHNLLKLGNAR